jgi:transcription initiation factor TFIIA small subunit
MSSVYQIYRSTTIGLALDETLHELVYRQILTPSIVDYIFNVFDQIITQSMKEKNESSLIFKGHLLSYRACDQVWTFIFDSLIFTSNINLTWKIIFNNQKIKIITCPMNSTISNIRNQIKLNSSKKFKFDSPGYSNV